MQKKKNKKILYFLFLILLILILSLVLVIIYDNKRAIEFNTLSFEAVNDFEEQLINPDVETATISGKAIIGTLKIDKIDLYNPIIEYEGDSSLEIAINKYAGPDINEFGNVVLASHNRRNKTGFARVYELNINDTAILTDRYGNRIEYYVTEKYYAELNDPSSLTNNIQDKRIVTLVTCNNNGDKRYIVVLNEKNK